MYMVMKFVQKLDLRNKNYEQYLVKNESGATTKTLKKSLAKK